MDISNIVILVIIAVAVVWTIMIYNNLVSIKHNVSKAWSNTSATTRPTAEPSFLSFSRAANV